MLKRRVGRYFVFEAFARGGMASVHLGRLIADRGFSRLVAVKMLMRGQVSSVYARALEEEARIASRIRHPNVVQPLDFVVDGEDILVVMEYVHGVALSQLVKASAGDSPIPRDVTASIVGDILKGLHAAHEATDELGRPLGVVHRDVSPHNVLVGVDGVARLADFGIAKVVRSTEQTQTGIVKGKLAYMPPEQLRGLPLTRQADIYSAGAVLAEALSGISPDSHDPTPAKWLPRALERIQDPALLDIVKVATKSDARDRFATAAEMSAALGSAVVQARADQVADRVMLLASDVIDLRTEMVRSVEAEPLDDSGSADAVVTLDALGGATGPLGSPASGPQTLVNPIGVGGVSKIEEIHATLHTHVTRVATAVHSSSRPPPPPLPSSRPPAPALASGSVERADIRIDAAIAPPPSSDNTLEPANTSTNTQELRRRALGESSRGGLGFFLFAGVAVLLLALGVWLRFGRGSSSSSSSLPVEELPANATTTVFPPAPPIPPSSASSTIPSSPQQPPMASASAPSAGSVSSHSPPPPAPNPPRQKPRPPTTRTPAAREPDCDPPFRIDAEGKKHYKPECVPH